jgi:4-alpha-glucanotransferase
MKTDAHWERIGLKNHHGIALPLFSLWTQKGPATFLDLIPLIDWCASLGFDVVQLLPLNDTGDDPSPYRAISSCALDPRYLSGKVEIRLEDPAYQEFYDENAVWLHPYARFKCLKSIHAKKHWTEWPSEEVSKNDLDLHCYTQFLCFQQMKKVYEYATRRKVLLLGDIPILINGDSADVWSNPSLFHTNVEAGAPPDQFNPKGQRWGSPLMNWDILRAKQYDWWKLRLKIASQFYHLYRIDHVVGFFRIWAIQELPDGSFAQGFLPPDRSHWPKHGRDVLEMMLDASPALPIAEDLGGKIDGVDTLKTVVRPILKEFGICGTKVLRWERRWDEDLSFIPYDEYEPYSLTTVSTHDSESLLQWWQDQPEDAREFCKFKNWSFDPDLSLERRTEILRDSHHTASYFHVNFLQEYLSLIPSLSWPNPEQERINVPGTISPKNWTYKFKPSLEEIIANPQLKELMMQVRS